jgi:hypothetical protein
MVNLGGTPAWIWVAFEPDLHAMLDLKRPSLVWEEEGMPPWLNGPRPILSLG